MRHICAELSFLWPERKTAVFLITPRTLSVPHASAGSLLVKCSPCGGKPTLAMQLQGVPEMLLWHLPAPKELGRSAHL